MIVALIVLIAGIVWLKDVSLHSRKRVWTVAFPNAGGLAASDEVQVNGIRRGQVRSMRLVGDRVIVDIELSRDVTVTNDSRVAIRNVGLMGEKVIAVDLRATGAAYGARDTIPGIYEPGLGEVMGQVGAAVEAVAELASDLRDISHSLNRNGRLEAAIEDFRSTSEQLRIVVAENRGRFNETMRNVAATARTAKTLTVDREPQLRKAIDDFASAAEKMDRLSGRLDSLRAVVQSVTSRVNAGEGTLGRLVKDDKLYDDLSASLTTLRALADDIKKHPKKYFHFSVF